MASIKILKLSQRIKERVGTIFLNEINDPRAGFLTVTRVDLARDLRSCTIYYSVLGTESDRRTSARVLEHARGHIQRKVAEILSTRSTPILTFEYDPSIEGSVRIGRILNDLAAERSGAPDDSETSHAGEETDAEEDRTPDSPKETEDPA